MAKKKKSAKKKTIAKKSAGSIKKKSSSGALARKKKKSKSKTKIKVKTKAKTKTKPKVKTKSKTKPKVKTKTKSKPKIKSQLKAKAKTKSSATNISSQGKSVLDPATIKIREKLVSNQQELLNLIQSNQAIERNTTEANFSNEIDMASSLEGREMMFQLTSRDRNELKMIQEALYKIDHGTYGICDGCSKKISARRLQILPLSSFCIECQESMEHV